MTQPHLHREHPKPTGSSNTRVPTLDDLACFELETYPMEGESVRLTSLDDPFRIHRRTTSWHG